MKPHQTIADYLELKDWNFKPSYQTGQHEEFFWVTMGYHIDCSEFIAWPHQPFAILMITFDGSNAGYCFASKPNWRAVGEFAVSDPMPGRPVLSYQADFELMLLDKELSDQQIKDAFVSGDVGTHLDDPKFWDILSCLQPYCYVAYTDQLYFISKDKALVDAMYSQQALDSVERTSKEYMLKSRESMWEMLGPECGPEVCAEPGCDRLRIQLAMRCFMHQRARP